jgi:hypothetical protein
MRFHVRISILTFVVAALVAALAPTAAQAGSLGVEKFFAGNCENNKCGEGAEEPDEAKEATEGFREAGGKVPFGVTDFRLKSVEVPEELNGKIPGQFVPDGSVQNLRVDVAPGVVTNPQAVTRCSINDFTSTQVAAGVFFESTCPESSVIGENFVETAVIGEEAPFTGDIVDAKLKGKVYNLEQGSGLGSEFGVALYLEKEVAGKKLYAHTIIEGNVEWANNYHDYFLIKNVPKGLIESRLVFEGTTPTTTGFLRNPTACTKPGLETTTTLTAEPYAGEGSTEVRPYTNKVGSTGCGLNFGPSLELKPETSTSDKPDGITTVVTAAHPPKISEPDTADLSTAKVILPEGMTINPSAAAGLAGCTRKQIGIETRNSEECPATSRIGTVELEVPTLPAHSLSGPIFLGQPEGKPIEGPPYTIYLDAESARYGVKVRIEGTVTPNSTTGQLETTFKDTSQTPNNIPQAPFNEAILHFNGGAFAPIANPLKCETGKLKSEFTPFSGSLISPVSFESGFSTENCSSPQFAPTQTTSVIPPAGGSDTGFAFNLTRPEGQQYVEKLTTTLPEGLVGKIPTVTQCTEAQASATQESGAGCPEGSWIGTVRVTAGSGEPYPFTGNVYLTGPYQGAPYGLAIKVPTVAGPFNLGEEITRAKISVEPYSARVVVSSTLPTIKGGIPIRMRSLSVDVSRPNYILNPTNCQVEAVESTVVSTLGTSASLASPFQVEGCSGLAFKPTFTAKTTGKTSKANGASLETTINQPAGQANIKSVLVTLPKQLPSRLSTLNKACPEATFAANPYSCPAGSFVGTARANTPVLPTKMVGPAIFVSHGGEAFPDLDLVLEADGIRVIVVGNTKITKGITTTNFATTPDVPVSSITVNLPTASNSALAANGNLCVPTLVMPVVITGQNGVQVKQNTKIAITGCGVQVVGHKLVGRTAYLTIKTFAAGRISSSGSGVGRTSRSLSGASNATTLKVSVSRGRPHKTKIRVGFLSKKKGVGNSSATVTVG